MEQKTVQVKCTASDIANEPHKAEDIRTCGYPLLLVTAPAASRRVADRGLCKRIKPLVEANNLPRRNAPIFSIEIDNVTDAKMLRSR